MGVSYKSLCDWVKKYDKPEKQRKQEDDQSAEIRQLRADLKRVTMERDILKEAAVYFAGESKKSTRYKRTTPKVSAYGCLWCSWN
ncbi:protein of unknown function [Vibrio tapetis subsp. tapetis]|uniref:Transposase n=1 Tax=Vibrio tapetis subsp. tapetis TaxID=1671868 RepID=A0A2N8ZIC6_9VIBR|nr:protein of unknown function [Vibrio tapetis subsp. tapetis]